MRGKKAKLLKRVIRNQLQKLNLEGVNKTEIHQKKYEPISFRQKNFVVYENKEPKVIEMNVINPVRLDFCERRAYQSLKDTLIKAGAIKNVKKQ